MNKDQFAPLWDNMNPDKRKAILNQVCTGCFKERRDVKKFYSEHTWGYLGEFLKAHIVDTYNKGYFTV